MNLEIEDWLERAKGAFKQVAELTLMCGFSQPANKACSDLCDGSHIRIKSNYQEIDIYFLTNRKGLQAISKMMLGLDEEESDVSDSDVSDSFNEIVNITAGIMDVEAQDLMLEIELSLPSFGHFTHKDKKNWKRAQFDYDLDGNIVSLIIYEKHKG